jgi:asparagine synthase (glutamine-hydrolysing)
MAHGLEVRAPFLDADLMAQAATLPEELKLAGSRHKAVLIDSIAEMPASFFARRKQGFSPPVEKWITGELRDYTREILLDPGAERRGLVRRSTVEDLLRHMDQFPDIAHDIYLLLALEVWAITCLDQDLDAPPRAEFEWSESHMPAQARSVHAHA